MLTGTKFEPISDIIDRLVIFLLRPSFQTQLAVIIVSLIIAYALARVFRAAVDRVTHWEPEHFYDTPVAISSKTFWIALVRAVSFPAIAIVILELAARILESNSQFAGLLRKTEWILWTLIAFQVLVTILFSYYDSERVRLYHYRLFLPLIGVIIALEVLSDLADLEALSEIVIVTLFDSPITQGALFIATIGLYFWTSGTQAVEEFLYHFITHNTRADKGSVRATLTLLRYLLLLVGIFYALGQLQLDPTTVAAITGGLSVGVGFALREILSNFLSGIILLFERSLHPGDVIDVDNGLSTVESLSIRATTVRTLDNVEVVIPNQTFFTSSFVTYTGTDKTVRAPLFVTTSCDNDLETVIAMLNEVAGQHEEVLQDPAPSVFMLNFGDNVINYQLNIWVATPLIIPRVKSDVKRMIWARFQSEKIDLTFPDMALHFPDNWSVPVVAGNQTAGSKSANGNLQPAAAQVG